MAEPSPQSQPGKRTSFWTPAMQDHCVALFGPEDAALQSISRDAQARGFPPISVSAADGQVLRFLVALSRAKRIIEIGTLGGYSALWMARALGSDGRIDTFELEPERAAFAREHLAAAKLACTIEVHVGKALEQLAAIKGPVDFVFIDADKGNYPRYLDWALAHLREGGVVAMDNAFAWGGLVDPAVLGDRASEANAMRATLERLAKDPRVVPAMIPTNEGLAVGFKRGG